MNAQPPEPDRVRANTARDVNQRLDAEALARVRTYAGRSRREIAARIAELQEEWDLERYLEANAATFAGIGVLLAASASARRRSWLALPGVVLPFLLLHAVQGWCPPVPLFRHAGIRTRREIDREVFALKALRGDFIGADDPDLAWKAADPRGGRASVPASPR